VSLRPACIADYESCYGHTYYGHKAGAAFFDVARLPPIVAAIAAYYGGKVLDIGGGNGVLASELLRYGVQTLTVDVAGRPTAGYIQVNLAHHDAREIGQVRRDISAYLGEKYFCTCLDVAEHIDIEHVADFLLNLSILVQRECLVSISTQPSSAANRFHASVLPIETWAKLFALAGFSTSPHDECQALRSRRRFSSSDTSLIAVSYWQRVNPFRVEHVSHQHYLRLVRAQTTALDAATVRRSARDLTDITYRGLKRETVGHLELPTLNYHVNFIQDWSFVRSLMDVWPADNLRVTLRSDVIAAPYLALLKGTLERAGCLHAVISSVSEGLDALEMWGLDGSLVATATEGVVWMTHLMGSLLLLEARRRGARTLCLQHGMIISRSFSPAAAIFGAWDKGSERSLNALVGPAAGFQVKCIGSPKFLDALMPPSSSALQNRLGKFVSRFERSILIGLNLHWAVHTHGVDETYQWIRRLCAKNPETLFVLRPHPDDATIFERPDLLMQPNLFLADELFMLSVDWPVARLIGAIDAVFTTYSTLAIDAVAAGKPVVMLPSQSAYAQDPTSLPPSLPWADDEQAVPILDENSWANGDVPNVMRVKPLRPAGVAEWFAPSWMSLRRIAEICKEPSLGGFDFADQSICKAVSAAARSFCFDNHPNPNRERVSTALTHFLTEHADENSA
jgi:hypothetical protein